MSAPAPCILARETGEPDLVFRSITALARHLLAQLETVPALPTGARRRLDCIPGVLARSDRLSGPVVAVRARDAALLDRGLLLGYVFMSPPAADMGRAIRDADRLMKVIRDLLADPYAREAA